MDPHHISVTPGSGSGSGGRSSDRRARGSYGSGDGSVDTSRTRRSHLSAQSTGTRLMPAFDDAAGDGDGRVLGSSSSSSSGGLNPGLEESTLGYNRHRVQYGVTQNPNLRRLLFHSSPVRQPTQDDEVIVMDGVLVDKTSASAPRRFSSSNDLGFAPASSSGSGASSRYGFDRQFSGGNDEPRVVQPIKRTSYEMEPQIGRPVQGTGFYMQRPLTPPPAPRGFSLFPPSLPVHGAGAPRGGGAFVPAMIPGHPGPGGGFPLFPPSLPGAGAPGGVGTIVPAMIAGHPGPGGFPLFPPSLPGAGPPPGATVVPVRTPGLPHIPPPRATPTAASAGPPPGFTPQRLVRRANASERPPPPPPPVAQQKRMEFSWPPKTAAAVTLPARAPESSAPKQPETEAPPASSSSAPSPREPFTWPLTEEEDELITNVLYGPRNRRRLPVFRSIYPD
ncbi:hypothetical protein E2562_012322 [Oryza meyeriana var. granulata]|uniref:Uncharacterized protein n=1 Tax=Oryza meyeriana var. granulata TaxID=110450 RepID=A0A6G1DH61_9ORYZ|nr:hypothetical protein E2562_012322 [Oryza meyeriana var. granulata]